MIRPRMTRTVLSPKHALLLVALALLGCDADPVVAVRVCGDLVVPTDVDVLRVAALDDAGTELVAGVQTLEGPLPVVHALGVLRGERRIVVQALAAGVERVRAEVRAQLKGDDEIEVRVAKACVGVACPLGQTCVDGDCEVVPFASGENCP